MGSSGINIVYMEQVVGTVFLKLYRRVLKNFLLQGTFMKNAIKNGKFCKTRNMMNLGILTMSLIMITWRKVKYMNKMTKQMKKCATWKTILEERLLGIKMKVLGTLLIAPTKLLKTLVGAVIREGFKNSRVF